MRTLCLLLLACVGCSGSLAYTGTPGDQGGTPSGGGDPIVGDGEIAGQQGAHGFASAADGAGPAAPGVSAGGKSSGASSSGSSGSSASAESSGSSGRGSASGQGLPAGTLTAGTWDDNRNFNFFSTYRATMAGTPGLLPFADSEISAAASKFVAPPPSPKTTLDVQLVIDTTGSMGDEIAYLQREFEVLATTIQGKYPQASQRWSLVLYRDTTDDYVVKWFDFRSDTQEFRAKLVTAFAGGGGDLPEAPDQAFDVAHRLSWRRDDATARILFWVADAPHHAENAGSFADTLRKTRDEGIHVYPVASSGVDLVAEHTMRSAAQLTGGRYLFLTDDSGVGNAHLEPRVPCFYVTKLDRAILRMVDVELSGVYREPDPSEILRAGGDPKNGECTLPNGTAKIY